MSEKKQEMQPIEKKELTPEVETTRPGVTYEPPVDIYESKDALYLVADMPGVGPDGVEVDLKDGVLTIQGHQGEVDEGTVSYREYYPGNYFRRFALSETIDQERIQATMKDGVLKLVLPKIPKAVPRKIEVHAS